METTGEKERKKLLLQQTSLLFVIPDLDSASTEESMAKGIYPEVISHQMKYLKQTQNARTFCKPLLDGLARQAQSRINPDLKLGSVILACQGN